MFSTRSHSRKEQAIKRCAIIVSHGQPSDPDPAEAELARLAAQVGRALPGWQVESATLAKPGALDGALAATEQPALVYPLFMTTGWFTGEALIKRLRNRPANMLPPLGLDPGLAALAGDLLRGALGQQGWQAGETRLFIAAHGSGSSENSARDTHAFAAALGAKLAFEEIRVGFVEEPPFLADVAVDLGERAICLPFFAARGGHVTQDIPEALSQARFKGVTLEPIGCTPGVAGLIARAVANAVVTA